MGPITFKLFIANENRANSCPANLFITDLLLEIEHLFLWVLAKILRNEQDYLQKSIFTKVRVSESAN